MGALCHEVTKAWKAALCHILFFLPTMMTLVSWGMEKLASYLEFYWSSMQHVLIELIIFFEQPKLLWFCQIPLSPN